MLEDMLKYYNRITVADLSQKVVDTVASKFIDVSAQSIINAISLE